MVLENRKEYGVVPPIALTVADPLQAPLQVTFVELIMLDVKVFGCVIVVEADAKHPLKSVILTLYGPAHRPEAVCVV